MREEKGGETDTERESGESKQRKSYVKYHQAFIIFSISGKSFYSPQIKFKNTQISR